ncbi:cryptococcal mannosyltransferase 1-domain-containing protein [Lipomyces orientalis]|uniref:Cryptococcal mannosyltransferase 1-domain-containing protein n=1 Tax=Lipomyces orientalis TaxID=1233043 RepID=A0ACC3TVE1_9ASCO
MPECPSLGVSSSASLSPGSSLYPVTSNTWSVSNDSVIAFPESPGSIPSSSGFKDIRQQNGLKVNVAFSIPLPKLWQHRRTKSLFDRVGALIHFIRRVPHALVFLVIPACLFRLEFMILTHNSLNLSVFVAFIFVYLPAKFVIFLYSAFLTPQEVDHDLPEKNVLGKVGRATAHASKFTVRNVVVIILGIVYTCLTFSYGLKSPFPRHAEETRFVKENLHSKTKDAYFIAANFYNNDDILPSWIAEVAKLIDVLGSDNVYVSLAENDSSDNSASRLLQFARYLHHKGVPNTLNITSGLRPLPHHDPWLDAQTRISYMTTVRNIALAPLEEVSSTPLGARMKNVIFLNDVIHRHTDVLKLLDAVQNQPASEFAPVVMACGLDMETATLYDQWAARDKCGKGINGMYPFFSAPEDRAAVRKGELVDVGTCWNGVVAMDAGPFLSPPRTYGFLQNQRDDEDDTSTTPAQTTTKLVRPLRFPNPPKCAISECTLLPLALLNSYLLTSDGEVRPRIVMDTSVIVAYEYKWWWYYAYFLRTPIVSVWVDIVERPILRLWEALGFGSLYQWQELDDGCVVDSWIHCPNEALETSKRIKVLMPDMDPKTIYENQQKKEKKVKDIEERMAEDLRMEERRILQKET